MLLGNSPHQINLRKGRFSEKGKAYSLTKCAVPGIILTDDPFSKLLIDAIFWMDSQKRFSIGAFVIMPDHYHLVIILTGRNTLHGVMKSLGSYTSREINRRVGTSGKIWQKGYYDRSIRRSEDLKEIFDYIHNNPVRKGLVDHPEEWPYSSLHPRFYKMIGWHLFM
jgi:REP element-mobilizing transposase RayT